MRRARSRVGATCGAGASNVVLSVAFTYDSRIWRHAWPTTMANMIDACAASGARLVFVDNLYQLGPQMCRAPKTCPLVHPVRRPPFSPTSRACGWQRPIAYALQRCAAPTSTDRGHRVASRTHGVRRACTRQTGAVAGTARHSARLRLRTRHRSRSGHAARRAGRRVRPARGTCRVRLRVRRARSCRSVPTRSAFR